MTISDELERFIHLILITKMLTVLQATSFLKWEARAN